MGRMEGEVNSNCQGKYQKVNNSSLDDYGVGLKYRVVLIPKLQIEEGEKHRENKGEKGENGVSCSTNVMGLWLEVGLHTVGSRHGCETHRQSEIWEEEES